jgi:hypothetical protein
MARDDETYVNQGQNYEDKKLREKDFGASLGFY